MWHDGGICIGDDAYAVWKGGAETGNRKGKIIPQKSWIDDIVRLADHHGIKVFMKGSLRGIMGEDFRRDKLAWEEHNVRH